MEIVVRKKDNLKALIDEHDYYRLRLFDFSYKTYKFNDNMGVKIIRYKNGRCFHVGNLHRMVLDAPDQSVYVEALNGDYLDCRRRNLRLKTRAALATQSNAKKRELPHGVTIDSRCPNRPYHARIVIRGRKMYLGQYATPEEAEAARLEADWSSWDGELMPDTLSPPMIRAACYEEDLFVSLLLCA